MGGTPAAAYSDVQALIDRMQTGDVDVLMVHGNPRYELPLNSNFVEAVAKVPFVVSFSSEVDETALLAEHDPPRSSLPGGLGLPVRRTRDRPAHALGAAARRHAAVRHPRDRGRDPGRSPRRSAARPQRPCPGRTPSSSSRPRWRSWADRTPRSTRPTATRSGPAGGSLAAGGPTPRRLSSRTPPRRCPRRCRSPPATYDGNPEQYPLLLVSLPLGDAGRRSRGGILLAAGGARPDDHCLVGYLGGDQPGDGHGAWASPWTTW